MSEDKALRRARTKLAKALEAGRDEEAIELLTQLRRLEPDNPRWPHKQGELLRIRGAASSAAHCFERAVALYAKQGFIARAVAMAKTVVELDPARIGILERIDPHAAQLLRTQGRTSRAAQLDREDRAIGPLPLAPAHDPFLSEAPRQAGPPPPPPQAARDPALLLGLSMPPRARVKLSPVAHPTPRGGDRSKAPPPPPRPPTRSMPAPGASQAAPAPLRSLRAAPPPVPDAALQPLAVPQEPAVTLDRLSLPPLVLRPQRSRAPRAGSPAATSGLDLLYGRAVRGVPELAPDPAAPATETRLSSIPPALRLSEPALDPLDRRGWGGRQDDFAVAMTEALAAEEDFESALNELEAEEALPAQPLLSEAELSDRVPMPAQESARPDPKTAATLAELPLFPLFAALPRPVLARIVSGSSLIELPDGAFVVREGEPGDALYGIVEGSVRIAVPGQPYERTLAEGDVFGEACLLEDASAQADVTVLGGLSALRIPREVLLAGVREHPPLAGLVLSLLTRRLLGNFLQASPLFRDFDATGKAELARLFEVRRVAAGTELAVIGKKTDGLYIALTGTLRVRHAGEETYRAPPGSMFGHSGLLTQAASNVEVICAVDMIVLRLPSARFAGIAMQHPTVLVGLSELSTGDVVRVIL